MELLQNHSDCLTVTTDSIKVSYSATSYSGTEVASDSEEEIRWIAASRAGNGSGEIRKTTTTCLSVVISGRVFKNIETITEIIAPVTVFDTEGLKRHAKWLKIQGCKHTQTQTRKYGSGCSTWYETVCTVCDEPVYR